MSKIVSFDFDGTLAVTKWPEIIRPIQPVVEYAKQCKANGDQIILNTMREGVRLQDAVDWCREQGIEFDAVNDNVQCMQEFYGNNPTPRFSQTSISMTIIWCLPASVIATGATLISMPRPCASSLVEQIRVS